MRASEEFAQVWWSTSAGPRLVVKEIEESIQAGKCVAVDLPEQDDAFRSVLEEKIRSHDSATAFFWIDAKNFADTNAVEDYLFKKYAGKAIPYDAKSKMEFIAKNQLLKHRVLFIFVDNINQGWIDIIARNFCRFCKKDSGTIVFLGPVVQEVFSNHKNLNIVLLKDYISSYDVQFFSMQCLRKTGLKDKQCEYTSLLASKLSECDGQLCAELSCQDFYKDPLSFLSNLLKDGMHEQLKEKFADKKERLNSLIWIAQLQMIFPIIEMIRRYLVAKHYQALKQGSFQDPFDMELRHIKHEYVDNGGSFTPQTEEYKWFNLAYECRNSLAHNEILTNDVMNRMFAICHEIEKTY